MHCFIKHTAHTSHTLDVKERIRGEQNQTRKPIYNCPHILTIGKLKLVIVTM